MSEEDKKVERKGSTGGEEGTSGDATNRKPAASRENGEKSQGPSSGEGKEHSKINAFQHGRSAARPDPVKLLLGDCSEEEAAERQALRQEMIDRYLPLDAFAARQAEELADLRFELRRMERVKEVALRREQELIESEKKRRARNRQSSRVEATVQELQDGGLYATPDSTQKYEEIEWQLENVLSEMEAGDWQAVRGRLAMLYGSAPRLWRGQQLWEQVDCCQGAEEGEAYQKAVQTLRNMLKGEIEAGRAAREAWEEQNAELTEAEEAVWRLEALSGRKWNWVLQRQNVLRQAIDRKVRILMDLRQQAKKRMTQKTEATEGTTRTARTNGSAVSDVSGPATGPAGSAGENASKRRNEPTKSSAISQGSKNKAAGSKPGRERKTAPIKPNGGASGPPWVQ